ncbi:phage tail tube protein [Paenibacillus sp. y28]|uniref:phage tail tube protein n=1 Tax=Paenibacillus sp. y28 TaxID=3129110 RepID=UPI00301B205E
MSYLRAGDTISGQEGRAFATINGKVEDMFYIKKLEAKVEKKKAEVKTLGHRGTQHKAAGWSGTGSMSIYYVTSLFRQMMLKYIEEGKDTYFDVFIVNEDPQSTVGRQTVVIGGVNLNSIIMSTLDSESDTLAEDIEFTFESVRILESFKSPSLAE